MLLFCHLTPENEHEEALGELGACPIEIRLLLHKLLVYNPSIGPGQYVAEYHIVKSKQSRLNKCSDKKEGMGN